VAQLVKHLPNKCEALSSTPRLPKKKRKKENIQIFGSQSVLFSIIYVLKRKWQMKIMSTKVL
jgi:hypothetical protein